MIYFQERFRHRPGLLLRHPLVHLHDALDALWLDEDGDGEELGDVEALDGVGAHVEDAVLAGGGHVHHGLNRGAVQVVVVLACLDEEVRLDVALHALYAVSAKGEEKPCCGRSSLSGLLQSLR